MAWSPLQSAALTQAMTVKLPSRSPSWPRRRRGGERFVAGEVQYVVYTVKGERLARVAGDASGRAGVSAALHGETGVRTVHPEAGSGLEVKVQGTSVGRIGDCTGDAGDGLGRVRADVVLVVGNVGVGRQTVEFEDAAGARGVARRRRSR